jgi:dipeptidyl aminopeptidase/acylaminoacyl peptidase
MSPRAIMFVFTLLLTLQPAAAKPVEPIAWEALCAVTVCRLTGHDGAFEARISPDGDQIAVTVMTARERGIFLLPRGGGEALRLADGHSPAWLADGSGIVFVHDSDLWRVSREGGEPRRLTEDRHDVRAPRPSPAGDMVVFASGRSGHQDLWLVPLDGSAPPRQLTRESMPLEENRFGHAWSPDGTRIAFFSNRADPDGDNLWLVTVESGEARRLSRSFMGSGEPSWSPDGTRVAAYGTARSGFWYMDLSEIFVVNVADGSEAAVPMQVHAKDVRRPAWSPDGRELFFPVHERGAVELWRVAAAGGVATRLTHTGGLLHDFDLSARGDGLVLVRSTPTRGREVDALALAGGPLAQLSRFASDWPHLVEPAEISYRSFDGLYIQAFLFLPPDFDPARRYPTVVQVHGGGTHSYYNGLNLVEQRLAQRGYVVLAVNYRGGSGFGRAFQDMGIGDWANAQALDAAAAADFVRAQPWSNGRVGIYGYSYGGIISLAAVTRAPKAFDAAVPMGGIYDFADAYRTADRVGRIFTREGHGGSPEQRPEAYATSDSLARIEALQTPLLIMHGEADVRAPFRQYQRVVEALERHGKVYEARSYPGEPHAFLDPANRVDMYQRLEAWMDRWLKGESEVR